MIKTQYLVPEVYYNKSRDFQALGRTFDIVFNYLKTGSDIIRSRILNETSDDKLIELLSLTLGFKSKHHYTNRQLVSLCSAFTYMLKNKGSLLSIESAVNLLLTSEGITSKPIIIVNDSCTELKIYVPMEVTDINLLSDLLTYILPAGMGCSIIRQSSVDVGEHEDEFVSSENLGWAYLSSADVNSNVSRYKSGGLKAADYDDSIGNQVVTPYIPENDRNKTITLWQDQNNQEDN